MGSKEKQVVVSGMRPTGRLHLGHLFGVLDNWVKLQRDYRCYYFVADWHGLTTEYAQTEVIRESLREIVLDWLAAGVDPNQSVLFVQSSIPEHAELQLLLGMITPLGWLERVPSYKELRQELTGKDLSTYGFLGYPLLQTADVAIYKANQVPVGQDQVAHLELAREIVRRFNHLYGEVFPEPQSLLTSVPKISGTDGRKMSKGYDNCVYLSDPQKDFEVKIKRHITDPARQRREDPGNPDICPIFAYHRLVTGSETCQEIDRDCRSAKIGCVDCKEILLRGLNNHLDSFRQRRTSLEKKTKEVDGILLDGSRKARVVAQKTLGEVHQAMGLLIKG